MYIIYWFWLIIFKQYCWMTTYIIIWNQNFLVDFENPLLNIIWYSSAGNMINSQVCWYNLLVKMSVPIELPPLKVISWSAIAFCRVQNLWFADLFCCITFTTRIVLIPVETLDFFLSILPAEFDELSLPITWLLKFDYQLVISAFQEKSNQEK